MPSATAFSLTSALLVAGGAMAAIMVSGTEEVWPLVILLASSGLAVLIAAPAVRPRPVPFAGAVLFCALALLAFLPQVWLAPPAWRTVLTGVPEIGLGATISPQPWISWFWWWLLAAACATATCLQTLRLEGRTLAVVLHAVALFAGGYAGLSIFAFQTGWVYPLTGDAVFGFLPNRNHTATLLVVGAVLSVGLMQWEAMRGSRGAALLAALAGAPCFAGLLFVSISRAGVVFLGLGLLLWAAGAARGRARWPVLGGLAVFALFLLVLFAAGENAVRERLVRIATEAVSVQRTSEAGDLDFRLPISRDTWRMTTEAPWTGYGLGQFVAVFPQYRQDSARAARVLHPESDWLMVAAETGWPAVAVLLVVTGWFFVVCWRGLDDADGMLRWGAASAVGAALAHGVIDVPWHRCSVGWLLLALAAVTVPPGRRLLAHPRLSRLLWGLAGGSIVAWAAVLGWDHRHGGAPAPFAWEKMEAEMRRLGERKLMPEAISAAREAAAAFPLKHEAYYYLGGFLRFYEETNEEIDRLFRAGRLVEPVLPQPVAEQARLWQPIDAARQIELSREAVRRAQQIDRRYGHAGNAAAGAVTEAVRDAGTNTGVQLLLAQELSDDPQLLAAWLCNAPAEAADGWASRSEGRISPFLDAIAPAQRSQVLDRWVTWPSAAGAVAYMEARNGGAPGTYWRQLANYYAKAGDKARAVGMVAQAEGVPLDGSLPAGDFSRQLAALQEQGNEVAARRLLKEAAETEKAAPDNLRVAMASYAASGDWEMAWKAASRLVTATKTGQ